MQSNKIYNQLKNKFAVVKYLTDNWERFIADFLQLLSCMNVMNESVDFIFFENHWWELDFIDCFMSDRRNSGVFVVNLNICPKISYIKVFNNFRSFKELLRKFKDLLGTLKKPDSLCTLKIFWNLVHYLWGLFKKLFLMLVAQSSIIIW